MGGLPNSEGRADIFRLHASGKKVARDIDYKLLARGTASFSGAEIMNVVNVAATMAVQAGEKVVTNTIIFEAIEKVHLERERKNSFARDITYDVNATSTIINRKIALHTAAKALLAYISPFYDDVNKLSCRPNSPKGQIFFIPQEEQLETEISTRSYLESRLTVLLATKAVERLFPELESEEVLEDTDALD